ncbi:MAG TPA: hypothetical protein VIF62_16625 [Labilithrix sp.]
MSPRAIGIAALLAGALAPGCRCDKTPESAPADADVATDGGAADAEAIAEPGGLSAPIAAVRLEGGDVIVAGLDAAAKAVRVQRLDAKEAVIADRTVLDALKWSSDADIKVAAAGKGAAITWRGLRAGKLVRQTVVVGADLVARPPLAEPIEVTAASCTTQDAIWFTDGHKATSRAWSGESKKHTIPGDADVSLVCGAHRAWAMLDEDEGSSFMPLPLASAGDAGVKSDAGAEGRTRLFDESAFGDDDRREQGEYAVGDDLGVIRLATSGGLAMREVRGGVLGPMRKIKTVLPRDADVVAVDASPRIVVVVYTDDVVDVCDGASTARVGALRIDRNGEGEETFELSPGTCGREVGPFFTGAVGDALSVAWVERVPVAGQSRAPIAGLSYRPIPVQGAPAPLGKIDQPADALVDAGCDATHCFAVALARKDGMDAMVPGVAKIVRY